MLFVGDKMVLEDLIMLCLASVALCGLDERTHLHHHPKGLWSRDSVQQLASHGQYCIVGEV